MKQPQQSWPRMVDPQTPIAGGIAQVTPGAGQQGSIAAAGTASRQVGNAPNPVTIYAKIYAGQLSSGDSTVPATPPTGCATVQPVGQNWSFAQIAGAAYAAGPPLPWNTLVVWAQFQDPTNPYDRAFTQFQGSQATSTNDGE